MSPINRKLIKKPQKEYPRSQNRRIRRRRLVLRYLRKYQPRHGANEEFLQIAMLVTPIFHPVKYVLPSINPVRNAKPAKSKSIRRMAKAALVKFFNLLLNHIGIRRPPGLEGGFETPMEEAMQEEGAEKPTGELALAAMSTTDVTMDGESNDQKAIEMKWDVEVKPALAAKLTSPNLPQLPPSSRLRRKRLNAYTISEETEPTEDS